MVSTKNFFSFIIEQFPNNAVSILKENIIIITYKKKEFAIIEGKSNYVIYSGGKITLVCNDGSKGRYYEVLYQIIPSALKQIPISYIM